ncbi:hypothetical protein HPB48_004436 [Haemaphysalis longicornis]|uniref:FP protein C-terminal domain-containing protein n=1 Tax=Haemaphysalis longicornis TaxID=44386 RepID=A0A9J6GX70_HAELO|nr:hypothetical protein HPB48_004436 [Haemaphysalis longicornis]
MSDSEHCIECIACHQALPDDGRYLDCSECKLGYHLGQACSGVSSSTFSAMGQPKKETWICKTCRSGEKRGPSQPEGASAGKNTDLEPLLLREIREIKTSLESLPVLHKKVDSLLLLRAEFTKLSETVKDLEKSVSFLSNQYDLVVEQANTGAELAAAHDEGIAALNATIQSQAEEFHSLREAQNENEEYSRKCNLEIEGLPKEENENLKATLSELARKLKISFSISDVEAVHRLPSKNANPTVLVRFATVTTKEVWCEARKKLRHLLEADPDFNLFFNENLTKMNRDMYWRAGAATKQKGYKFCWATGGNIYAKKDDKAPSIRVSRESDINKIT